MKTLLVLRHAKSSWADPDLDDHERPLNKRGLRDAPRMGRLLESEGLIPDLILSSTAVRARTTALMAAEAAGCRAEVRLVPELYLADPSTYVDQLRRLLDDSGRVMVVGHNPGMEDLLEELTGDDPRMPTAALAAVGLEIDQWSELDARARHRLHRVWRPKELQRS